MRTERPGEDWLRGKRALLAEDNLTNQMVATQMLEALGVEVEVASDGAEALDMLSPRFDLFLVDIEMPRVSGLDVIRAIRDAEPPMREAPVIAVTAYALREHRAKIEEAGADGLIPKPLISIEQFGRDIVACSRRAWKAPAAAPAAPLSAAPGLAEDAAPAPAAPGAAGPIDEAIDEAVYDALAEAIGREAMADLLEKLDIDLDRCAREVERGARARDIGIVTGATHILVSVCGAIGGRRAEQAAQRLNAAAHARGAEGLEPLAAEMQAEIAALRRVVGERLKAGAAG